MAAKLESRWLWVAASLLLWCLSCWFATGTWFDRQAQQSYQIQRLQAEQFVAQARPNFNRIIKSRSGGPRSLARASSIRRALSRFAKAPVLPLNEEATRRSQWRTDPELIHASNVLKLTGGDTGLDSMLLLDVKGYCVAASDADSAQSSVGTYFGEREDFRAAQLGRSGTLAGVDKNTGVASLSFYAPVMEQGRFLGVVVGVNTLPSFIDLLNHPEAFLTDDNGVVLLAHEPSLLYRTLPDSQLKRLDATTRQALYQRTDFKALTLSPAGDVRFPELLSLRQREAVALLRSRSIADGKLNIHVLWPMPQLAELTRLRLLSACALGLIGSLILLVFILYTRRQREQRTMALTLAQRDQNVKQASDFLNQIVNAIADPLVVKDQEHRLILVNQAFCSFMGQPREHLTGKTVRELLPELQARRFWDAEERVLSSGIECTNEEKLTDALGATHIVVVKNTLYTDGHDKRFVVGILSDITQRKQVERLLRAKEREFSSLAGNLPVAVIRYDNECRRRYLNLAAEKILRASSAELLGLHPGGPSVPVSTEQIAKCRSKMEEVLATDAPGEIECVLDGLSAEHQEYYEVRFVPEHDPDGKTVGVLTIWHDITERKRLESELKQRQAEFHALAENLPDPVFRYDRDCRRVYVNPAAIRVTKMSKEQLLGHRPSDCPAVHPASAERTMASIQEVFASGERRNLNVEYFNGDGTSSEYQGWLVPEFSAQGEVVSVLTMAHDVTALRQAERHAASFFANMPGFAYTLRFSANGHMSLPFVSNGIEDLYGLRPEDVRDDATPMHALEHPEDLPRIEAASALAIQTLQPFRVEFRVQRPGHPQRWVESRSMPLPQSDGSVLWHGVMIDITERKSMENTLAKREHEFRSLAESSPDNIVRYDQDGRIVYLNAAVLSQLEVSSSESILGKRASEVWLDQHSRQFEQVAARVVNRGKKETVELLIPNRDGDLRVHEIVVVPERNASGQITGTLAFGRDISAIREAEQRQALFLANLPGLTYTFRRLPDGRGEFPYVSPAIETLYGLKPGDIRHDMSPVFALLHPEDRLRLEAAMSAAEGAQTTLHIELRVCRPDHVESWVEVRSVPVKQADTSILWYGLMLDVSERKRAEQRLLEALEFNQGIISALPDILFEFDRNGRYLNAWTQNPEVQEAQKSALLGKTLYDVMTPDSAELAMQAIWEAEENGTAYGKALCTVQADGQVRWYEYSFAKRQGGDPSSFTFLALARDITSLRLAQERQNKSHDLLRALAAHQETQREKQRKELAYQIHEDLAQNLAALRLNLSFLAMRGERIEQAPEFKTINDITERSLTRVRDMVSVLRPAVLDLGLVPALEWLIDDFRGIGFHFDVAFREDIALSDEVATLLFRATQEALLNVALHAEATHVGVSLDEQEGLCSLKISDNGCGFDAALSHRTGRFGLIGLTEQTRHLGGALLIDSEVGRGTVLTIFVPTSQAQITALQPTHRASQLKLKDTRSPNEL